ncbi:phosphatase PAP2 family protein [candidate division KSB3 bacterium]|uniref:Phosphatase PAP2 family protein n=1 Tax=candidate division KSB3 bacterium TaxID=2044937 RepID=A0A9D5JXG2_9BACT|nr:phosphatase PAP2 family protein [candidate division KSB3 bacterium]MBD3325939.1 phosphatase PAP2 family protein [candidate division KSB3 bacterium]
MKRFFSSDVLIALGILAVLTVMFRVTELDLTLQHLFFVEGHGWVYKDLSVCRAIYTYGPLPAILLAVGALLGLVGSWRIRRFVPYRKAFIFVILLMLLGPGLVVNAVFKQQWGRPRPRTVDEFGGPQPFLYVWQKGEAGAGHSFASGHASMGFFLVAPYFLLRRRSRRWALTFLATGIGAGVLIGVTRMVQGGHFASDVIWAGGFVYLVGAGLASLLRLDGDVIPTPALASSTPQASEDV